MLFEKKPKSFSSLLCLPDAQEVDEQPNRSLIHYENLSKKYALHGSKDYSNQYCKVYAQRLSKLRPRLEAKAVKNFGNTFNLSFQ